MKISFEMELSTEDTKLLSDVVGCTQTVLPGRIADYAKAATLEYVHMMLGQKVFTRMSDVKEYRLFLLIKECLGQRIPDDQMITDLFQSTPSESKSLVRAVLSKYQYELKDYLFETLKEIVQAMSPAEKEFTVTVNSATKVEELNRKLLADGTLHQILKKPGTISVYTIKPASYTRLCQVFGVTPKALKK